MQRLVPVLLVAGLALASCSTQPPDSSPTPAASVSVAAASPSTATQVTDVGGGIGTTNSPVAELTDLLGERPFDVLAPTSYDGTAALPLVVLLHGFAITGAMQDDFFHVQDLVDSRGFLMVSPDGTRNADGAPFWNATDACCGFGATVDDSAYLAAVIRQVQSDYAVDAQRIFLVGFSNGGFMAHRMACDHADLIAGIVSISGATFLDPARCAPTAPVNVVEIHGTNDETIAYEGGTFEGTAHPGAPATVASWASNNECSGAPVITESALDLSSSLAGAETTVLRYDGCPVGGAVELWTIVNGPHVPALSSTFSEQVVDYLLAHPKPPVQRS